MKSYENTMTRAEIRWHQPQKQDVIDQTIDVLKKAKVDGWVCSGINGLGIPLFPSQVYPYSHPQANREWLDYLLKRAEEENITVVSWYCMMHSNSVADKYPEYHMRLLDIPENKLDPKSTEEVLRGLVCINSPYLDLLENFSKELIMLGFKGIWFDDNSFGGHYRYPGCLCRYCGEKFNKDTGFEIPTKVDFTNSIFKTWLNWRYQILEQAWRRLTEAVHSVNPEATVCFNNTRATLFSWQAGIPLKRINLNLLMSGESNGMTPQADFQIKLHTAMNCSKGAETWVPVTHSYDLWRGNPEPETMLQGALAAVNAGGNVFCGTDNLISVQHCLHKISAYLAPIYGYRGGKMLKYAGIWVSQQMLDFEMQMDVKWDTISYYGANEMLNHAHLQTGVLFDDSVESGDLLDFPIIIGAENTCVSDRQITNLLDYVKVGGGLVVCGRFANKDELGNIRESNPIHELLDIRTEEIAACLAYGELNPAYSLGDYPESIFYGYTYQKVSFQHASSDVSIAAMTIIAKGWQTVADNPDYVKNQTCHIIDGPGILVKRYGKGVIVYFNSDVFTCYAKDPNRFQMELVKKILTVHFPPQVEVKAPMPVTVNVFDRGTEYVLHLHNNPGRIYRSLNNSLRVALGEVPPALDIECDVSKLNVSEAFLPRLNKKLVLSQGKLLMERLDFYDVVVLKKN